MKPSRLTYNLGKTQYGQQLTLEHIAEGYGRGWRLTQHAHSQRDETQTIHLPERLAQAFVDILG